MKTKKFFWVFTIIFLAVWFIYNLVCNETFFVTPFYSIVNIVVAVVITYSLTQYKNDVRRKIDFVARVINKYYDLISSEKFYEIKSEDDIKNVMILHREISNKTRLLSKYSDEPKYVSDIEYINKQISDYWNKISDNIYDVDCLKNSKNELKKYTTNIKTKLEEMEWELYG